MRKRVVNKYGLVPGNSIWVRACSTKTGLLPAVSQSAENITKRYSLNPCIDPLQNLENRGVDVRGDGSTTNEEGTTLPTDRRMPDYSERRLERLHEWRDFVTTIRLLHFVANSTAGRDSEGIRSNELPVNRGWQSSSTSRSTNAPPRLLSSPPHRLVVVD